MEYNFIEIGERIRTARKSKKLSQEKLIETFKNSYNFSISRNTLSKIENGEEKSLTFDFLYYFSKIVECDIGFLLCEYDEREKELHEICDYVQLGEETVNRLHKCKKSFSEIINDLIVSYDFWAVLGYIEKLKEVYPWYVPYRDWLLKGIWKEPNRDKKRLRRDIEYKRMEDESELLLFHIQNTMCRLAERLATDDPEEQGKTE